MREDEAIEKAKRGDSAGMTRLYELYKHRVYSCCLRYTGNVFDAEDLTHEVFIQVFRKISSFRGESELGTWIYKVGLNSARLHWRQQRRVRTFILADVPDGMLNSAKALCSNPMQALALVEAMSTLTPARRKAFLLHDLYGLTVKEIATCTGVTTIAIKSRLHQAHIAVRRTLRVGLGPNTSARTSCCESH